MSDAQLLLAVLIFVILATVLVTSAMVYLTKMKKLPEHVKFQRSIKRFRFYYDFVLSRRLFRKIYQQITMLSVYTAPEARYTTVKFFERAYAVAALMFITGLFGLGDVISAIVLAMFAVVMINVTISKRIDKVNFECLRATSQLCLSLRESYTRVRNVPDALNDCKCPSILQKTLNQIYLICTANDADERLHNFYRTCPNRIIRTLATTCYIRSDVGEEGVDRSPFKEGIGLISDEVNQEVRRQINQNLMFRSLDKLPFIPMFLYPPIKMFYTNMISATAAVFESGVGYMIKLVVVLTCFICYYVLSTMNNASVARTDDRLDSIVGLLQRPAIKAFATSLVPRSLKQKHKFEKITTACLSSKTIDYFYFEKLIFGTVSFILSILFSIIILFSARNSIYNSLNASVMSVTLTYTAQQKEQVLEYDHNVLAMEEPPSKEEMMDFFDDVFPKASSVEIEAQADRVAEKFENYHGLHFQWWYAIIYIIVACLGYNVPNFLLGLRAKLVKSEAELDVLQLQTVIAILMDTTLDTSAVLYWLAKSSDIHKSIINYCYHDYWRDPEKALLKLKRQSTIPEFSAMCDKLITTIHQVSIAEAFEDLVAERDNTMRIREMYQTKALQDKRNLAGPIATFPMMVWLGAVFILPIGIVAVKSAVSMLANFNNM